MPPMSLPEDLVEQARRDRERQALDPITSQIDRMVREGMGGIEAVAKGAAEQVAPVMQLLQGGELKLPTLDDLTPEWMRPKPVQAAAATPSPGISVTHVDGRQQPGPSMRPGEQMGDVQITQGARPSQQPVEASGGDYGEIDNSSRESFVRTAWPYMLDAAGGDKNLAELMLAKAISENGDVGKGGGFIGNNFSGIKGEGSAGSFEADTWEDYGNGRVNIRDRFAAYHTPQEGFRAFMAFLHNNERYAPALARYQQSGDASQLFRDIRAAGYATDPIWADKIENIRANQVAPVVRGASGDMQRLSLNTAPTASPAVAADTPAGAGAASPPAPASTPPPSPWANETGTGGLMMKSDDATQDATTSGLFGPGDGGTAPQTYEQPYDPDSGAHEWRPPEPTNADPTASDPSYSAPRTPDPMTLGTVEIVNGGPPTENGGEPTGNGQWTEMPVRPLEAQQPAPDEQAASLTQRITDALTPIYNAAGTIVGYMQGGSDGAAARAQQQRAPQAIQTAYNSVLDQDTRPRYGPENPDARTGVTGAVMDAGGNAARAAMDAATAPATMANGLPMLRGANIVMDAINQFGETVGRQVAASLGWSDEDFATVAGIGISPMDVAGAVGSMVLDPTNLISGEAPAVARGVRRGVQQVAEGAPAVARRAGEVAQGVGRGAYGLAEEAAYQATFGPRSMAQNIVPPGVARQIPGGVKVSESPLLRDAVENTPGAALTRDGLEMDVQRFQREGSAGLEPSGGGVFYGPGGGRSPYQFADDPEWPPMYGGSQQVQGRTLLQRPFVHGEENTSETLVQLAVEGGRSSQDARRMVEEFLSLWPQRPGEDLVAQLSRRRQFSEATYNELARKWGLPEMRAGDGLPDVRIYEALRAALARDAGYDSVVKVGSQRVYSGSDVLVGPPKIIEAQDLREATYPTPDGGYTLRPEFQPPADGGPGIGRALASGADDAIPTQLPRNPDAATRSGIAEFGPNNPIRTTQSIEPRRMYHGTGTAFESPDPSKFDEGGLFGPGYYLTSDQRVANGYATVRAGQFEPVGSNVRAVEVPANLRLWDLDAPGVGDNLFQALDSDAKWLSGQRLSGVGPNSTPEAVYDAFVDRLISVGYTPGEAKAEVNRTLHRVANFDGIKHTGGRRNPLMDDAGNPIEHDVTIIFPESLTKIRNAFSGEVGGATLGATPGPRNAGAGTRIATDIGNSLAGGMAGAVYSEATGDQENMGRNVVAGMVGAPILGRGMRRAGGAMGTMGVGPNGRPSKPTVEVLQQELDGMRSLIQRARAAGDAALEKRAIDRAWQLESELVDARNARLDLEPRISSDVGRRIEDLPLDARSADDFAGLGRERVSPDAAADLTQPSAVATDMSGRMNSAVPFDPASAAMGGAAGAMSEGEDGEQGDPLRTAAGVLLAGVGGGMSPGARGRLQRAMQQAERLKAAGRMDEAAAVVQRALDATPGYEPRLSREPVLPGMEPPRRVPGDAGPSISDAANRGPVLGDVPPSAVNQGALPGMDPLRDVQAPGPVGQIDVQRVPNVGGVPRAVEAAQRRQAAMAARGREPLSPLQWTRALAANIGYSSMIGPATATVNIFGNLLEPLWAIPKEFARSVARGNPREFAEMAAGAFRGMGETGTAMLDAITARGRYASNPDHPTLSAQTSHPLLKAIATGTEVGGRVFSGMPDAIFGTIARSAGEARQAAQIATDEGLKGNAWKQRVKALLGEVEQSRKGELTVFPSEVDAIVKAGEDYADSQTFRQKLGTVGNGAAALAGRNIPVVGNLITPFFNTPWNMGVTLAERSPIGAVMNRQRGFDKAYDALAGSALIAGIAVGPAAAGYVTGSGPDDPEKRKMLEAEGWKPYHTLVGGVYVPNRVFGIYGKLLNAAGEAHDAMAYQKKDGNIGSEALRRFGMLLKEEPYLQGLSDIMQAINAPNGSGLSSYGSSTLTRMIPYASTARAIGTAMDPNERTVDSGKGVDWQTNVAQRVQQGVGLRSGLPVAQDVLGRPKENPQQGLRSILPALRSAKSEPMVRAFFDAGVDISGAPSDIDGVPLTPAQQRQYQQVMGRELQRIAGPAVGAASWQNTPPNVRKTLLETFQSTARTLAEVAVSTDAGPEFARQRAQKSVDKALGR